MSTSRFLVIFAPGPETSGTAFFTYGMLWGVNDGILDCKTYMKIIIDNMTHFLK